MQAWMKNNKNNHHLLNIYCTLGTKLRKSCTLSHFILLQLLDRHFVFSDEKIKVQGRSNNKQNSEWKSGLFDPKPGPLHSILQWDFASRWGFLWVSMEGLGKFKEKVQE